jgi:hypothetical protein
VAVLVTRLFAAMIKNSHNTAGTFLASGSWVLVRWVRHAMQSRGFRYSGHDTSIVGFRGSERDI